MKTACFSAIMVNCSRVKHLFFKPGKGILVAIYYSYTYTSDDGFTPVGNRIEMNFICNYTHVQAIHVHVTVSCRINGCGFQFVICAFCRVAWPFIFSIHNVSAGLLEALVISIHNTLMV